MFAVIGSNSRIGNSLAHALEGRVIKYSRALSNKDELFFDLKNSDAEVFKNKNIQNAVICAGITDIAYCEANPLETNEVNCIKTVKLIESLNNLEIPVTVISSSSVFGIYNSPPSEDTANYSPTCRYALQKAFIEDYALGMWSKNRVIRLTKVVSLDGVFKKIVESLINKKEVSLFDNLRFSPVSLSYVITSIIGILNSELYGVFHLSGENTYSYYEFALSMFRYRNPEEVDAIDIIKAASCSGHYYMPNAAHLNMLKTSKAIGILPQNVLRVFDELNSAVKLENKKIY